MTQINRHNHMVLILCYLFVKDHRILIKVIEYMYFRRIQILEALQHDV